ncbi:MAG: SDR family NAD(P)-dependent oxidoreductase [Burkholderiales bacterium]
MSSRDAIAKLFDLTGRSALVTGASGALGSAAAHALVGAGASVTLAGGNAEALAALHDSLAREGARVAKVVGRPSNEPEAARLVEAALQHGGGIDILVSASGAAKIKPALDMTTDEWDGVMEANVRQSWLIARAAGRVMTVAGRGGKIVFVSSVRARFATASGTTAYSPSKAGVDMLTRSFAAEWGKFRINVNAVAPAVFRSDLTAWLFEEKARAERERILARIPIGRLAEPDDFAGTIVFLASRASDYVTGEILHVDGGFSAN